jgi:hypothetical protein
VWLERQRDKRLPVDYFLVTFTLPAQLRYLAFTHQRLVFSALFSAATQTLFTFADNAKHLGADIGMTAVLHTHNRKLQFHPHVHVLVPGGGIDHNNTWVRPRYQFLFNHFALAKVFRAKLLHQLDQATLALPANVPAKWLVDCTAVGSAQHALAYLSRYLYRGVIRESDILAHDNGQVTFRYTDSQTHQSMTQTLPGEDFIVAYHPTRLAAAFSPPAHLRLFAPQRQAATTTHSVVLAP